MIADVRSVCNSYSLCYLLQELLIYKSLLQQMVAMSGKCERKSPAPTAGYNWCDNSLDTACITSTNAVSHSSVPAVQDIDFVLMGHLSLPDPILALRKVDMTGDGLLEIGVLSLKGLHILQVSSFMHLALFISQLCHSKHQCQFARCPIIM